MARRAIMAPPTAVPKIFAIMAATLRLEAEHAAIPDAPAATEADLPAEDLEVLEACRRFPDGFATFLNYWHFTNRETGDDLTFADLWPGQAEFRDAAIDASHRGAWLFALKAGKLGFTELECAWDAYVARFRQRRARVNIFSKDGPASVELLGIVKYGIERLPAFMGVRILDKVAGGDTTTSLKFTVRGGEPDDVRSIVSFASGSKEVSIDVSATHIHLDEFSHVQQAEALWGAVSTTVAPHGSLHIVSRGAGRDRYSAKLWAQAMVGRDKTTRQLLPGHEPASKLIPFFANWRARPDRDERWHREEQGNRTVQAMLYYAPETPEDALAGDSSSIYIPLAVWDACYDPALPPLMPGAPDALVIAMDAAVSNDFFAVVTASRHPADHDRAAIRAVRVFRPEDFASGTIDYEAPEMLVRFMCLGGCAHGHPNVSRTEGPKPSERNACQGCALIDPLIEPGKCYACEDPTQRIPAFNVAQITYDAFQLHDMTTKMRQDGISWVDPFDQGSERLIADGNLHRLAMNRRVAHNGDPQLREGVSNAKAKLQDLEDSKMRIIKSAPEAKVDTIVAGSMAVARVMALNL